MAVKRTVRTETVAVFLDVSFDEFLIYEITMVQGSKPIFTLVDSKTQELILSNKSQPDPPGSTTFKTEWPTRANSIAVTTVHTMGMSFLLAQKYTYIVKHHRSDGSEQTLIDIDYESKTPQDWFFQGLTVMTD